MTTETLWINSLGTEETGWSTVGSTPYLDSQDQPSNYIYSAERNRNHGNFTFTNSSVGTGTINSVHLYVYCQSVGSDDFNIYLNGNSLGPSIPSSWGWINVNVSSILTSWSLIDSAYILFDRKNTRNRSDVDAAYLYIDYVESSGPTPDTFNDLEYSSEPPTGGAWNQLVYESEPPTTNAWNRLKYKV